MKLRTKRTIKKYWHVYWPAMAVILGIIWLISVNILDGLIWDILRGITIGVLCVWVVFCIFQIGKYRAENWELDND